MGVGKMDPFTVLTLGDQKYKTKTAMNQGKTPKWNETFNFIYDSTKDYTLNVQSWDQDTGGNDILGSTDLDLRAIYD